MQNADQEKRFSHFFKKYSLSKYSNPNLPTVFWSLWSFSFVKNHHSFGVIIWRGTDIQKLEAGLKRIKKMSNIYHVAVSSCISKDLNKYGIKHKFIPIVGVDVSLFKPCPLGDEIYTYVPSVNPDKYYPRYGMDVIKKVQKRVKYKINITSSCSQYNRKDLLEIYKRCFCTLRFTRHDGLPNSVIETGLMGRRSFYNGNIPGCIKWDENKIDKMVENIEKEAMKIGTTDANHANIISKFISAGDKWLHTEFWTN